MISRTLAVLQSLVFPWHKGHYHAPSPRPWLQNHKKRKTSPSLDAEAPEYPSPLGYLPPSLEDLNVDAFQLIADQLYQQEASLQDLALSSRKLRSLCFPILFRRCRADLRETERGDPPEAIRAYVRHLTLLGPLDKDADLAYIESLLSNLPCLTSIALEELCGKLPWAILKACIVLPHLTSLSVHLGLHCLRVPPFPQDDLVAVPISVTRFSYAVTMWREQFNGFEWVRESFSAKDMRPIYDFERQCLLAIVPRLSNTVTSLALPIESAPILAMAELSWPHLRELTLHGRFIDPEHVASLQSLLPSLSSLHKLSILAGRFPRPPLRYPILPYSSVPPSSMTEPPSHSSSSSPLPAPSTALASTNPSVVYQRGMSPSCLLSELCSLAIAYPDPEDGVFSLNLPNLRHLSLRDQPRVYHRLTCDEITLPDGPRGGPWLAPLLSPEECLSILKRMDLSLLTSFELVYLAHEPGEDDGLLSYIVEALPCLEHLELHRYRGIRPPTRKTQVDHMRIAQILSASSSLLTLRLNLDFHDDHQAYCLTPRERERWLPLFKARGFEIVDFLQESCPCLEYVALLYHGRPAATWAEFHPQRCAEPRFVLDYTKDHVDSEPCPRDWVVLDNRNRPIPMRPRW